MMSLLEYLSIMFMGIFWLFRLIIAVSFSLNIDIGIAPLNMNMEMILLFFTLICMLLVGKRKIIGGILYLVSYGAYYGMDVYSGVFSILKGSAGMMDYTSILISFLGIVLPIIVLFEMLLDKNRREHPVDKKTDWYYKTDQYDRKYDERADKNNYRTL